MLKLSDREWKVFPFSEIFEIRKGFYNKKPQGDGTGTIPFLGATDAHNGITAFLTIDDIKDNTKTGKLPNSPIDKKLFPGHAIAVTNNGSVGHAYYQATPFTCSHDINPLYLNDHQMSSYEAMFLIDAIEKQGKLFQYARKWRPIRMVNSRLLLPITTAGEPDYEFMGSYVKERQQVMLNKYVKFAKQQLEKLGGVHKPALLSPDQWGLFRVGELFKISRPISRNKTQYQAGQVPYIASGAANNGVAALLQPKGAETIDPANSITISPVDGSSFYQPVPFLGRGGGGSSIIILRSSKLNALNGPFIARMVHHTFAKYSYGHMANSNSVRREIIMLPSTPQGAPDYDYMENYTKYMMAQKYQQYLEFAEGQLAN